MIYSMFQEKKTYHFRIKFCKKTQEETFMYRRIFVKFVYE